MTPFSFLPFRDALLPLIGGFLLAGVFLTTLRLTIARALGGSGSAPRPWLFLLGFVSRLVAVVAGMTLLCGPSAESWLWCLAGFVLGKVVLVRSLSLEVGHAHL